jgi:hypothetical protein
MEPVEETPVSGTAVNGMMVPTLAVENAPLRGTTHVGATVPTLPVEASPVTATACDVVSAPTEAVVASPVRATEDVRVSVPTAATDSTPVNASVSATRSVPTAVTEDTPDSDTVTSGPRFGPCVAIDHEGRLRPIRAIYALDHFTEHRTLTLAVTLILTKNESATAPDRDIETPYAKRIRAFVLSFAGIVKVKVPLVTV